MDKLTENKIREIAANILDDKRFLIVSDLSFDECTKWDSVNRVLLLTTLEEEFDILYKVREIASWNTLQELLSLTDSKI